MVRLPVLLRRAMLGGVVIVTLVVSGCTGSDPDAKQVLAKVDEKTLAGRTSQLSIRIETLRPGQANPSTRSQSGQFDYADHRGRIKTEAGEGSPGPETIFIGNDVYTSVPPSVAARVSGGKPWLKRSQLVPGGGGVLGQLVQPTDPIELLRAVRTLATGAEYIGREQIRGTPAGHFRLKIDITRLPTAESDPANRDQITKRIAAAPKGVFKADLWVDDAGRARRLRTEVGLELLTTPSTTAPTTTPGSSASTASPGALSVTTEWFDFGAPVDVQPPPAEAVADGAAKPGG